MNRTVSRIETVLFICLDKNTLTHTTWECKYHIKGK